MSARRIAPWWRDQHRQLARGLPSVVPARAAAAVRDGWTRIAGSGGTWCSSVIRPLAPEINLQTPNPFRLLVDLPEIPQDSTPVIRAVRARVRFLDGGADTAKAVRRAFNSHGGAARYVWNAAVKWIQSLPEGDRLKAYNKDLLNKRFNCATVHKLKALDEEDPLYQKKVDAREAKRKRIDDEQLVIGGFLARHPWLKGINATVRQQAVIDLVKAHQAGMAKMRAQKGRGERVRLFTIKTKHKSKPSSWTFCVPAQAIKAEHVARPTNGKAVRGQQQPQNAPQTWTKLLLPANFGSGKRGSHPVVYLTHKADIKDGKLLADVRFCRDRMGHWCCVVQRAPIPPRPRRPAAERKCVFLDPGSRTGWTGYSPDAREVSSYVAGEGGMTRVMRVAMKMDALIREQKSLPQRAPAAHRRFMNESNLRKHRLNARVKDLVRDAHVRVARDLTARYDTIVLPMFETQRMVRKPLHPSDPRRKLNAKAARALITLSHFKFRSYLAHRCRADGRELHMPGEEYTTKACPHCGTCYDVGSSKTFSCRPCSYTADRDEKAAFTYALKCMRLPG